MTLPNCYGYMEENTGNGKIIIGKIPGIYEYYIFVVVMNIIWYICMEMNNNIRHAFDHQLYTLSMRICMFMFVVCTVYICTLNGHMSNPVYNNKVD